jgi:hypothetical protein
MDGVNGPNDSSGFSAATGRLRSAGQSYILDFKMTANFSRFGFTFRYWRTIAGSAD